jgi:DNA-binding NarL/FixJ family response regulator
VSRFVCEPNDEISEDGKGTPIDHLIDKERRLASTLAGNALVAKLDEREKVAVRALLQGKNRRQMAEVMKCSLGTVQNVVERLRIKPEVLALRRLLWGD